MVLPSVMNPAALAAMAFFCFPYSVIVSDRSLAVLFFSALIAPPWVLTRAPVFSSAVRSDLIVTEDTLSFWARSSTVTYPGTERISVIWRLLSLISIRASIVGPAGLHISVGDFPDVSVELLALVMVVGYDFPAAHGFLAA